MRQATVFFVHFQLIKVPPLKPNMQKSVKLFVFKLTLSFSPKASCRKSLADRLRSPLTEKQEPQVEKVGQMLRNFFDKLIY